jgi:hypothetical protein
MSWEQTPGLAKPHRGTTRKSGKLVRTIVETREGAGHALWVRQLARKRPPPMEWSPFRWLAWLLFLRAIWW